MTGTILRRGKTYSVVLDRGRDPTTGRRLRDWRSGYRTRKEAEAARAEMVSRLNKGLYVEPNKITVADYLVREWLPATQPTIRPSTFQSYEAYVLRHVVPGLGAIPLQSLSASQLNAFYGRLLNAGRLDGKGGLSQKSVHYIHTIIHKALRDAVRWSRLARNVAEMADPPKVERDTSMTTWTPAELRAFLESVSDDPLYPAWLLAASTGMRRGEVLGLRWSDVDLDAARVAVRQTIISVAYEVQRSSPKTKKGKRQIVLDRATVQALRDHRRRQAGSRLAMGPAWNDQNLLFTRPDGNPIHPDRFSKLFGMRVAAIGVPRISLHGLRHTHATLALMAGGHPKIVSERLGHASIGITLDTYSHVIPSMQEGLAQEVADLVLGSTAG